MKEKKFFRNLSLIMGLVFILVGVLIGEYIELRTKYKELSGVSEQLSLLQVAYDDLLEENSKLRGVELPLYDYTEEEIYLLAQCVEAEAGYYRGHENSQQYITQVILNRVGSSEFPNSIEEVIYQKVNGTPQFSVAYNGMIDREVQVKTLANVYYVLLHGTDLPKYVLYFYSDKVSNNWVNSLSVYMKLQGTVFAYSGGDV